MPSSDVGRPEAGEEHETGVRPGYLTRDSIIELIQSGKPGERLVEVGTELARREPDVAQRVGPWNYDLHLGEQVCLSSSAQLQRLAWGDDITIGSGEFALLTTEEVLHLPLDIVGFISLRFSTAVKGLVNISGRHVDPGYHGLIVFSVYNASPSPCVIARGDAIFMIVFSRLDRPAPKKLGSKVGNLEGITSDWRTVVRGPPISLSAIANRTIQLERSMQQIETRNLESRLVAIETTLKVVGAIAAVVAGAALTWWLVTR